ncbi:MAG: riboflavin synthase [Nitrospinota bacterium]
MFTGIIEAKGSVSSMSFSGGAAKIVIEAENFWDDANIGDSIAVDGVCLTITEKKNDAASFDVSKETLDRSVMGSYKTGVKVNLEKPLRPIDRLGGHFVQGHVDGVGRLLGTSKSGENVEMSFDIPEALTRYVVEKGSITINGISLTAATATGTNVKIAIIPHTLEVTNLLELTPGAKVNIECDIIAKYTEKLLLSSNNKELDLEFLKNRGFA